MWEYILGGATVFGLIVTLGAWINGRLTRKILMDYFEKSDKRFEELFRRMDEHFRKMDEHFKRMDEYFRRMDERFQELVKQHNDMLARLGKL